MKNYYLMLLLFVAITSCQKDETTVSSSDETSVDQENLAKIRSSTYYTFDSKADLLSEEFVLDSTLEVESMYEVSEKLQEACCDTSSSVEYESLIEKYSDILAESADSDYFVVVPSLLLSKRINSNGVVQISDTIYVFSNEGTYKYKNFTDSISLIKKFKASETSLKSTQIIYTEAEGDYLTYGDEAYSNNWIDGKKRIYLYGGWTFEADLCVTFYAKYVYKTKYLGKWRSTAKTSGALTLVAQIKDYDKDEYLGKTLYTCLYRQSNSLSYEFDTDGFTDDLSQFGIYINRFDVLFSNTTWDIMYHIVKLTE